MFGNLLQYEIDKKITKEDVVEIKKIIDSDKMRFTYYQLLHEKQEKFKVSEQFINERFYCLSLNKSINDLQISFLNTYYYRNMNKSINPKVRLYRMKDAVSYEELYFYYFFITVDGIFKIIDKTGILLNDCLNFGLNKEDNNFNISVIKAMNTIKNDTTIEINNYLKYMSNYKNSVFNKTKEEYRNKNTHDFTNEIPKYRIIDNQIMFDESLKIDKTYSDLLSLLDELKKYIKLVDDVVIYSINKQGSD